MDDRDLNRRLTADYADYADYADWRLDDSTEYAG